MITFSHSLMHILIFCFSGVVEIFHPLHLFPNPSMARTRGGHIFRPWVRSSSPPPAAEQSTPPVVAPTASPSPAPVPTAPAPRRYDTWVRPTPPSPAHPRPSRRARTSDPGESSSSRPQDPHSQPVQGPVDDLPLDLSPASIIRRPFFHRAPIISNFRLQYQGSALRDIL